MAAPTPNWSLPLYDGTEPGVLKTLLNALSNAVESALNTFKSKMGWGTLGPYTSLAALTAVTPDHDGQKASVAGSATASENGTYTSASGAWTADDTGWVAAIAPNGNVNASNLQVRVKNRILYITGVCTKTSNWLGADIMATFPSQVASLLANIPSGSKQAQLYATYPGGAWPVSYTSSGLKVGGSTGASVGQGSLYFGAATPID